MNRIDLRFEKLKKENKKAFVAYITAGDPDLNATLKLMRLFVDEGVDVIELGVPFSDPIGDGPVNQAASERALSSGTSLSKVLKTVSEFRKTDSQTAVVLFSYMNPLYHMGFSKFAQQAKESGVDGVLTVDGPFDMNEQIRSLLNERGIHSVYLVAPTTTKKRMKEIAEKSGGFIYCISSLGVTGVRQTLGENLNQQVSSVQKLTDKPVCVGFGISTPETAAAVARVSDGVIVGSAFVRMIETHGKNQTELFEKIRSFTKTLVNAVKSI